MIRDLARRLPGAARREPWLVTLMAATAVVDAVYSILRHVHLQTGFDLALADQAVWHYSRFEAPFSSILNKNILGDHFSPLVALLSPLYWVWSDPRMLLLAQSLLVAGSIVPVFLFARSRIGRAGAYLLAAAYAAFWGLQGGVGYEFHELAFAPVLIASAVLFADRRRWGWFWFAIVLLLAVKEDLAMLVVFFGLYLLTLRERRHGLALIGLGILWFVLSTRVLIPHFSLGAAYSHWTYGQLGSNLGAAVLALVRAPWRVFEIGLTPARKLHTIAGLLAPFLLLSLYSRLIILAIPLLLERFLSTDANFWGTAFHYSLSISPVLAMAAADGLANVGRLLGDRRQRAATVLATATMLAVSVALTMFAVRATPPRGLFDSSLYSDSNHAASALSALNAVPPGAVLATNDDVLPHASQRPSVSLIAARTLLPDFMVADAGDRVGFQTGNLTQQSYGQVLARNATYMTPAYYAHGWLLLRRSAARRRPTNGALEPMPAATSRALVSLAQSWQFELLGAGAKLAACDARWAARDPRAGGCVTAALTGFQTRAQALASPLAAAVAALRGGCRELGAQALAGTRRLADDLAKLAPAARSANRSELPAATAVAGADQRDRDIPGQLQRFLILCSPRS